MVGGDLAQRCRQAAGLHKLDEAQQVCAAAGLHRLDERLDERLDRVEAGQLVVEADDLLRAPRR